MATRPSYNPLGVRQFTSAPNPLAGEQTLFPKTDGKWYTRTSAGLEYELIRSDDSRLTDSRPPTAHTLESHSNVLTGTSSTGDGLIYEGGQWSHRQILLGDLPSVQAALDTKELVIPVTSTPPSSPVEGQFWIDPTAIATQSANISVGPNDPNFVSAGLWVQTLTGANGLGTTFWIEDGT